MNPENADAFTQSVKSYIRLGGIIDLDEVRNNGELVKSLRDYLALSGTHIYSAILMMEQMMPAFLESGVDDETRKTLYDTLSTSYAMHGRIKYLLGNVNG